ncbi:MAG: MBL fold metallo-hydrolase [Bdellovibrionaceae bacterium]|nr:MBL fold metallo-hydrolase [Pseudobdellovibrionaceae bacterium]
MKPAVKAFFDDATYTLTYVVWDETTKDAVIIDPVLDYDPHASKYSFKSNDMVIAFVKEMKLKPHYILETHAHADHLSGSQDLKSRLGGNVKVAIGERIREVQKLFKNVFNFDDSFKTDGSQFDELLSEEKPIKAGSLEIKTIFTPGHTPACASYLIGDALFTGDALFMPDYGTGRCDFPAGSSDTLYDSISKKLYSLPDETRVFVGHDYQPNGRGVEYESTIGEEKRSNIQLNAQTKKEDFVSFRNRRDKGLSAPRLLLQSVQFNINAGKMPDPESNGVSYLKIPLRPG